MRLIFMGTPALSLPLLERLAVAHEILAVYTRPDSPAGRGRKTTGSPVKQLALNLGLAVEQPSTFKDPEVVEKFSSYQAEAVVVIAYGKILPESILSQPPLGCLNVHFSLLPRHRGASPVAGTILAGDTFTGITVMLMDSGMDTGPILTRHQIPVRDWDTTGTLGARLSFLSAAIMEEVLPAWARKEIRPREQDGSAATYSGIIHKEAGIIDWQESATSIWRKTRAYSPWPGTFTFWQGKKLKILQSEPVNICTSKAPGTVIELSEKGMPAGVVAGSDVLGLARLQLEGKNPVTAGEFLRGRRDLTGSILG